MKLSDLNQNNIQLGYSKKSNAPLGFGYQARVPTSLKQTQKAHIDSEDEELEQEGDVNDVKNNIDKVVDTVQVANSMAGFKDPADMRKPPNISNVM